MRGKVAGLAFKGSNPYEIDRVLSLTRSTVQYTLQQDPLRDEGEYLPRKPRNLSYTEHNKRVLLRHVRLNPKDTYKQVITAYRLKCKTSIVKKILKKHGITN